MRGGAQLTMHVFMEAMHGIEPSAKLPLMTMPCFAGPVRGRTVVVVEDQCPASGSTDGGFEAWRC
jgi:hypothetical protein